VTASLPHLRARCALAKTSLDMLDVRMLLYVLHAYRGSLRVLPRHFGRARANARSAPARIAAALRAAYRLRLIAMREEQRQRSALRGSNSALFRWRTSRSA